jgi:UDP-N-acetylmuramyl pentapeptide phosphotransferase/UDP-N-acetylglucosamine-1-phosphate transferase
MMMAGLIIMFGVVILYVLANRLAMSFEVTYLLVLVVPIIGLLVWSHVASMSKLRALGIPDAYIRTFHRSRLLVYVGIATFVALVLVDFAKR